MTPIVLPYDATEVQSRPSFSWLYERNLSRGARVGDGRSTAQREADAVIGTIGECVVIEHASSLGVMVYPPDNWWEDFALMSGDQRVSIDVKACRERTMSMTRDEALLLSLAPDRLILYLALKVEPGQFTVQGLVTGNRRTLTEGPWRMGNNGSRYVWLSDIGQKNDTMTPADYFQLLQDCTRIT